MTLLYDTFSENYIALKTQTISWEDKEVHVWLEHKSDSAFSVEITLLSFDVAILQWLRISCFYGKIHYENQELTNLFSEVSIKQVGKPLKFEVYPQKGKHKKQIVLRVANSWHSEKKNASFNPGEVEHYGTGNTGMLIKETETPGCFIVSVNSGAHSLNELPLFQDILFEFKVTPFTAALDK